MSCIWMIPILLKINPYDIFRVFCYLTMLRILDKIPFLFFFSLFSTNLKHSEQRARRLTGLLSFREPLMCSNCGGMRGLNLTLHFWQRLCARSSTVCLIASVRCSYFFLSKLGLLGGPKKDTHAVSDHSNLFLAITENFLLIRTCLIRADNSVMIIKMGNGIVAVLEDFYYSSSSRHGQLIDDSWKSGLRIIYKKTLAYSILALLATA